MRIGPLVAAPPDPTPMTRLAHTTLNATSVATLFLDSMTPRFVALAPASLPMPATGEEGTTAYADSLPSTDRSGRSSDPNGNAWSPCRTPTNYGDTSFSAR